MLSNQHLVKPISYSLRINEKKKIKLFILIFNKKEML